MFIVTFHSSLLECLLVYKKIVLRTDSVWGQRDRKASCRRRRWRLVFCTVTVRLGHHEISVHALLDHLNNEHTIIIIDDDDNDDEYCCNAAGGGGGGDGDDDNDFQYLYKVR